MNNQDDVMKSIYRPLDVATYAVEQIETQVKNKSRAITLGVSDFDQWVKPVMPGEVVYVLAHTSNGKTSFMQYWARQAVKSLKPNDMTSAVVYVTWESVVEELGLYDLCGLTGIDSTSAWYGDVTEDDVARLRMAAIKRAALPLWVIGYSLRRRRRDHLTMAVVSESLRRMEEDWHVKPAIIFIDYVQKITLRNPRGDRRAGIIENVDAIQALARDCGCAVVAGCQAGRDVVTRDFKLPAIGDGQECVVGDTMIMDARTGEMRSVVEWAASRKNLTVHAMDNWKLVPATVGWIKPAGEREIWRVTTNQGHRIRVSGNHPFFSATGWKHAEDLHPGDWVAVARKMTANAGNGLTLDRAEFLGLMLGDGSYTDGATPSYTCGPDKRLGEYVASIAKREWSVAADIKEHSKYKGQYHLYFSGPKNEGPGGNALIDWLREIGVYGQKHDDATVPEIVQQTSDDGIKAFVRGLATADGSFPRPNRNHSDVRIYISSVSRIFVEQVRLLLLRCGIRSSIGEIKPGNRSVQTCFNLAISGRAYVELFMQEVGFSPSDKAARIKKIFEQARKHWTNKKRDPDLFPPEICLEAIEAVNEYGKATGCGKREHLNMVKGRAVSRVRLLEVGNQIDNARFVAMGEGDVTWARIETIERDGTEQTYDLHIPKHHNFVANGLVTHNTSRIEQDGDKVISLLYACKSYPIGSIVPEVNLEVTDDLMIVGVRKQRRAASGATFPLRFDPVHNTFENWQGGNTSYHQVSDKQLTW